MTKFVVRLIKRVNDDFREYHSYTERFADEAGESEKESSHYAAQSFFCRAAVSQAIGALCRTEIICPFDATTAEVGRHSLFAARL
ncbi:MAG: hypothetical protein ABSD74_05660 [Rhizomicrobium sp.]|jgi:hypothetical protein